MTATGVTPESGFRMSGTERGGRLICYRTRGMRALGMFEGLFLATWTGVCVSLIWKFLTGEYSILPFAILFVIIEYFILEEFAWDRFAAHSFLFEADRFVFQRRLLWYADGWVFGHGVIEAVTQVKDGGEDEDSFPSWGLVVEAPSAEKLQPERVPAIERWVRRHSPSSVVPILSREAIGKSDWLGPIVAHWAGVPFERAKVRR
jgi:hypothetical protein